MRKRTATVTWSQVATASGYRVYWGTTSRVYSYSHDVGQAVNYRVPNLRSGTTYYFSARSYNDAGQSDYGNEVIFRP